MKYTEFLFSQLFMNHIENNETNYKNLEYDLIFPFVIDELKKFTKSNYNIDILPLYDCMVNYIQNEVK